MNFLREWFSVDEQRVSALILSLLSTIGVALYAYVTRGDISSNIVVVIETLVTGVAGINIANTVANYFSRNNSNQSGEGPQSPVTKEDGL